MKKLLFLFLTLSLSYSALAQPNCSGADSNYVFMHHGGAVWAYDPQLPFSPPTNPFPHSPTVNPSGGLSISTNFSAATPSPTWYTVSGGNYNYWNGAGWSPSGHSSGGTALVNPGGGKTYIYNLYGANGQVWRYDGAGGATLLTTLGGSLGPYDLVTDTSDNFFRCVANTSPGWIIKYNSAGVPIDSIIMTGNPVQTAGGGFAMVKNYVVCAFNTNPNMYAGQIVGNTVNLLPVGQSTSTVSDMASCAVSIPPAVPGPPPIANFGISDDTICAGTCIDFYDSTINAPIIWNWSFPTAVPLNSSVQNPTTICFNTPGTHTVQLIASNANGADTITKDVVVIPNPVATLTGDSVLCEGEQTTLFAGPTTSTFLWSNTQVGPQITVSPTVTTAYSVIATENGCSDTASVTVDVTASIQATITGDNEICEGQSSTLNLSPSDPGYTYWWSTGGATSSTTLSPASTVIVSGSVTNGACTDTTSFTLNVNPQPTISISNSELTDCDRDNGIAETTTLSGTSPYTYLWDHGPTVSDLGGLGVGNYNVTVTDAKGCTSSTSVNIGMHPNPVVSITPYPSIGILVGDTTQLQTLGLPYRQYQWSPNEKISCLNCPDPFVAPRRNQVYCLQVWDDHGCTDTACTTILVDTSCVDLFIPNAFSPNGDGLNDYIQLSNNRCVEDVKFIIYNRWGQAVFEAQDRFARWDGTFNGEEQPTSAFFYFVEAKMYNGRTIKKRGDIILLR